MRRFEYLMLLALCLALTLPLEFVFRGRVWRRPRRLLVALVPTVAIFGAQDAISIARGHWTFSERLTTGIVLPGGLPLDEVAFFAAIPICGLLTFEAIRNVLQGRAPWPWR